MLKHVGFEVHYVINGVSQSAHVGCYIYSL